MSKAWIVLALLAGSAQAGNGPAFPFLRWGATFTGATAAVSVSPYADSEYLTAAGQLSGSTFLSHGPLTEWALSVNVTGTAPLLWTVDVEISIDNATWTRILRHTSLNAAAPNASIVWGPHKKGLYARLRSVSLSTGAHVSASAYAEP